MKKKQKLSDFFPELDIVYQQKKKEEKKKHDHAIFAIECDPILDEEIRKILHKKIDSLLLNDWSVRMTLYKSNKANEDG